MTCVYLTLPTRPYIRHIHDMIRVYNHPGVDLRRPKDAQSTCFAASSSDHKISVPKTTRGKLCGSKAFGSSKRPFRGPKTITPLRAPMPPVMWTTMEPAKSVKPMPESNQFVRIVRMNKWMKINGKWFRSQGETTTFKMKIDKLKVANEHFGLQKRTLTTSKRSFCGRLLSKMEFDKLKTKFLCETSAKK